MKKDEYFCAEYGHKCKCPKGSEVYYGKHNWKKRKVEGSYDTFISPESGSVVCDFKSLIESQT